MTDDERFRNKLPSLHLFCTDESLSGPFCDVDFIRAHYRARLEKDTLPAGAEYIISNSTTADMKTLRERIFALNQNDGRNVVLFNSPYQASIAPELMLEFAWERSKSGHERILIVDCNARTPALNRVYQLSRGVGLAEHVIGTHDLHEIIMRTNLHNVFLIRSGSLKLDPVHTLMSKRLARLFKRVCSQFDFVLVNTPPYRDYVDAFVLAKFIHPLVLLVLSSRYSSWSQTRDIRDELAVLDVNVLGVLNNR
ncbi:MAG: tyrosine-protein kinase family protein [bacterium]